MSTVTQYRPDRVASFAGYLLSGLFMLLALTVSAQINWTVRPQTLDKGLNGSAFGQSTLVVVGDDGLILTSSNGATYVPQASGTAVNLQDVLFDGTRFIAVGNGGNVLISADGLTWSTYSTGTSGNVYGITFAPSLGLYVVVGETGVFTSPNALTWTKRYTNTANAALTDVTFGGGKLVAVGFPRLIVTSTDGINWSAGSATSVGQLYFSVAYGKGLFVLAADAGTILTSPNGTTWTSRNSGVGTVLNDVASIPVAEVLSEMSSEGISNGAVLNNINVGDSDGFIAVGDAGVLLRSTDGIVWVPLVSGTQYNLRDVSSVVIVGEKGTIRSVIGNTSYARTAQSGTELNDITYGNGQFVAVGYDAGDGTPAVRPGVVLVSPDGVNFITGFPNGGGGLYGVAYGGGVFAAVGANGLIQASDDGVFWKSYPVGTTAEHIGIAYGKGTFVGVGAGGDVVRSTFVSNTLSWSHASIGLSSLFRGITFGNNLFVATGEAGAIRTSPDGQTWTGRSSGTSNTLNSVAYGSGVFGSSGFVAVGNSGTVRRSDDGVTWTTIPGFTANNLDQVTYGHNQFVAGDNQGNIFTSIDGKNWTPRMSNTTSSIFGIAYGNNRYVAVGAKGLVDTAPDAPLFTNQPPVAPVIASQTATVGVGFIQSTPTFIDPNASVQFITVQAFNLPPGLAYGGGASGIVAGNPTTAGVYSVSLVATDEPNEFITGGLSATAVYTITVNPAGGLPPAQPAPFSIQGVTLVGCALLSPATPNSPERRAVTFTPQLTGTYTSPVTQSVVAAMLPTTSMGPFTVAVSSDAPTLTLIAVDAGGKAAPPFSWNWVAACNGGGTNTPPTVVTPLPDRLAGLNLPFTLTLPATTFTDAETPDQLTYTITGLPNGVTAGGLVISGSPTAVTIQPLVITVTATDPGGLSVSTTFKLSVSFIAPPVTTFAIGSVIMNACIVLQAATANSPERRQITFTPQLTGTYTLPVTQSVVAAMLPTSSPGPFTLNISSDAPQLTLVATDAGGKPAANYTWNWLAACNNSTRLAAEEKGSLQVVVLGNPTPNEAVEVEISGVAGESVQVDVVNLQGLSVSRQLIERAGTLERQWVKTGRSAGLYLIKVQTATQSRTVKLLKQ